jgi:hypothetical protein
VLSFDNLASSYEDFKGEVNQVIPGQMYLETSPEQQYKISGLQRLRVVSDHDAHTRVYSDQELRKYY